MADAPPGRANNKPRPCGIAQRCPVRLAQVAAAARVRVKQRDDLKLEIFGMRDHTLRLKVRDLEGVAMSRQVARNGDFGGDQRALLRSTQQETARFGGMGFVVRPREAQVTRLPQYSALARSLGRR